MRSAADEGHAGAMTATPELTNPSIPPDKHQKYARPERECRFLVAELPPGEVVQTATITDRYLLGTRLRRRRTVEVGPRGTRTFHELTHEVPAPDENQGVITTVYLSEALPRRGEWIFMRRGERLHDMKHAFRSACERAAWPRSRAAHAATRSRRTWPRRGHRRAALGGDSSRARAASMEEDGRGTLPRPLNAFHGLNPPMAMNAKPAALSR